MNVDFNLDNYELIDILKLFNLNYDFNVDDLKQAKKIVLQLHPDKSGLDKEYFLFYSKAFRIIKGIYDFKNKKQSSLNYSNSDMVYLAGSDEEEQNKILIDKLLKNNNLDFNKWFNETFEKINIIEEEKEKGYGDWLKSDEDIDNTTTTYNMMHKKISEKKEAMSALVKKQDIKAINNYGILGNFKELDGTAPSSYESDIFSNLQYEDLRKAHTETVVPVCDTDYQKMQKFNNIEDMQKYRNGQNIKPMSETESNKMFYNQNKIEDEENVKLAYKLAKQNEQIERANNEWWSKLRLLQ
jgi:hypothetical protein